MDRKDEYPRYRGEDRRGLKEDDQHNIVSAIEAGLGPVDLKGRYNELKSLRDELEHSLDEKKRRNPAMSIEDIKWAFCRCGAIFLNSLKERKILIDLMINSVILNADGSIDIVFNYREKELYVPIPFQGSTTPLTWSTIKQKASVK